MGRTFDNDDKGTRDYKSTTLIAADPTGGKKAYAGPYTPPGSAPPPGDTSPPLVGGDEDVGVDDWKKRSAYWKDRALSAEAENRRLHRQNTDQSWELDNHRETARRIRDEEIGRMGGGG